MILTVDSRSIQLPYLCVVLVFPESLCALLSTVSPSPPQSPLMSVGGVGVVREAEGVGSLVFRLRAQVLE